MPMVPLSLESEENVYSTGNIPFVARPAKSSMRISITRLIFVNCSSTKPTANHNKQAIKAYFLPSLSDTLPQAIWPTPPVTVNTTLSQATEAGSYWAIYARNNGSQKVIPVYIPTPIAEQIAATSTLGVLRVRFKAPGGAPPSSSPMSGGVKPACLVSSTIRV